MAVQGAAPSRMAPAMYSFASSGVIQAAYSLVKNTHAKKAMVKGLINQLTTTVRPSPFSCGPMRRTLSKSTCTIMG